MSQNISSSKQRFAVPGYVDIRQAADMLGVHPKSITRAHRMGRFKHMQPEVHPEPGVPWTYRRWLFPVQDVKAEKEHRKQKA